MKTQNHSKGTRPRKLHRMLTIAAACVLGATMTVEIASAQTTSTPRRGSGSGSGGTTTGTTTTTRPSGGDARTYLPYELDKPIDEMLLGRTSYTQLAGDVQVSLGGSYIPEGNRRNSELVGRIEYGITNQLEVHGEVPMALTDQAGTVEAQASFSSIELGASYALTAMNDPMAFTASFAVDLPIGDNAGADETLFKPALIAGYDFGPTELHMNAEAVLGGAARGLNFDAGLAHSLGTIVPTVEFNARAIENGSPELYLTPGLFYNISNRVEIGAGVPIGLNDISPTGVAARINVLLGQ